MDKAREDMTEFEQGVHDANTALYREGAEASGWFATLEEIDRQGHGISMYMLGFRAQMRIAGIVA